MASENLQQLVLQRRWTDVEDRVKTHPEELSLKNDDDLNVFHLACCRNPPSRTIRIMLRADAASGSAALMTECYGRNPLMYVCDGRGPVGLVEDFVECAPHCISKVEEGGWTPLHFLCVNTREHSEVTRRMAKLLLSVDPSMLYAKDNYDQTPLKLLCDQFESLAAARGAELFQERHHQEAEEGLATGLMRELEYFWSFACMLVQSNCPNPTETPILHQFCSFPQCPEMLLSFALHAHHDQMTLCCDAMEGNTPLHLAVLQRDADLLLRLLAWSRDALRIRNHCGQLPISLAFDQSWSSALHLILLNHHPGGLDAAGVSDLVYPQLLSRANHASTIYGLLRNKPALLLALQR